LSMSMKITWLIDDTIRVQATCYDFDAALFDPDSHQIIVTNPAGSAMGTYTQGSTGFGTVGTGTFRYDYVIPSDGVAGIWKVSWKALSGTYPAREIANFMVAK